MASRKSCWREERLAKEGRGPERRLRWRERVWSWERWERSEGRVPERDLEERSMEVTRLELSQFTPVQPQKDDPVQPGGGGVREAASFDMTEASSAEERWARRRRRRNRVFRGGIVRDRGIIIVIIMS